MMVRGIGHYFQAPRSKSVCPIHCCRSSWCCSNWYFLQELICLGLSLDCCQNPQVPGFWNSLLFRTRLRRNGRNPFESKCGRRWSGSSPPHRPIPPLLRGLLSVWTAPTASIPPVCCPQIPSTSFPTLDPRCFNQNFSQK